MRLLDEEGVVCFRFATSLVYESRARSASDSAALNAVAASNLRLWRVKRKPSLESTYPHQLRGVGPFPSVFFSFVSFALLSYSVTSLAGVKRSDTCR